MTGRLSLLALSETKPGRGEDLESFLKAGRELAVAATDTVTWYACRIADTTSTLSTPPTAMKPALPTWAARSRKPSPRSGRNSKHLTPTSAPSTSSPCK